MVSPPDHGSGNVSPGAAGAPSWLSSALLLKVQADGLVDVAVKHLPVNPDTDTLGEPGSISVCAGHMPR